MSEKCYVTRWYSVLQNKNILFIYLKELFYGPNLRLDNSILFFLVNIKDSFIWSGDEFILFFGSFFFIQYIHINFIWYLNLYFVFFDSCNVLRIPTLDLWLVGKYKMKLYWCKIIRFWGNKIETKNKYKYNGLWWIGRPTRLVCVPYTPSCEAGLSHSSHTCELLCWPKTTFHLVF